MKKQVWEVLLELLGWKEDQFAGFQPRTMKQHIEGWLYENRIQPYMLLVVDVEFDDGVGFNALELDVGEDLPQSLINLINNRPVISQLEIMGFLETEIEVPFKTHNQLDLFESSEDA